MAGKATGERLRGALVILVSLTTMLAVAAPALSQEGIPVTGVLTKPEITSYQYGTHLIVDETTGASYALESGSVDLDAYLGQAITIYGAPVPGYQDGQIEGGPEFLNVTSVDAPSEPLDPASKTPEVPPAPPGEEAAIQAAQTARQASDIAQTAAEQSVQQATDTGDPQALSQATEEAQQASETAQVAAEEARQAAEQAGTPEARAAAQEAQQAADEAEETSGAAQTVARVAQQATQQVADVEEIYAEALQAARSNDEEDNLAFAAEYGLEETDAVPAGTNDAGEDSGSESTEEDTSGGKKAAGKEDTSGGKKAADKKDKTAGEAGAEEDTGGVGSNTSTATPAGGSVPLLLGGSVLLLVGIFVARKLIR